MVSTANKKQSKRKPAHSNTSRQSSSGCAVSGVKHSIFVPESDTRVATNGEKVYRQDLFHDEVFSFEWIISVVALILLMAGIAGGQRFVLATLVKTVVAIDNAIIGIDLNLSPELAARYAPSNYQGESEGGTRYVNGNIPPGTYAETEISSVQAKNLSDILNAASDIGATQDEMIAVLMAVMQESSAEAQPSCVDTDGQLHGGSDFNDDSGGFFQQRPSMGWGTCEEVNDVSYAVMAFLNGVKGAINPETGQPFDIIGYRQKRESNPDRSYSEIIQSVQKSAYPDAYNKWLPVARVLVREYTRNGIIERSPVDVEQEPVSTFDPSMLLPDEGVRWIENPIITVQGGEDYVQNVLDFALWFNEQSRNAGKDLRIVVKTASANDDIRADFLIKFTELEAAGNQRIFQNNGIIHGAYFYIDSTMSPERQKHMVLQSLMIGMVGAQTVSQEIDSAMNTVSPVEYLSEIDKQIIQNLYFTSND